MTDEELDLLVEQASPISDSQVASFDLGSGELDLMEAIRSTTLEAPTPLEPTYHSRPSRRRPLIVVAVGEMTFSDGSHEIELRWGPGSDYAGYVDDRPRLGGGDRGDRGVVVGGGDDEPAAFGYSDRVATPPSPGEKTSISPLPRRCPTVGVIA